MLLISQSVKIMNCENNCLDTLKFVFNESDYNNITTDNECNILFNNLKLKYVILTQFSEQINSNTNNVYKAMSFIKMKQAKISQDNVLNELRNKNNAIDKNNEISNINIDTQNTDCQINLIL